MFSTTMSTCRIVEHSATSGDDRGGIAVSRSRVFYTGDTATIHASLTDLSDVMTATPPPHDGLLNDVGTGEVYVMLNAMGAEVTGTFLPVPFTITQLGVLNGTTGALTTTRIPLSMPIAVGTGAAVFSGRSRAYIHTGSVSPLPAGAMTNTWYQIRLPSGVVSVLRTGVTAPSRTACEGWATWGVAEFFDGEAYAVLASSIGIQRHRIRDGMTTTLATSPTMTTLFADMCTFTVSPSNNRWYFKWEGAGFAGGVDEVLGFCSATISMP
jgi:hypothetical protein